jgi:uncharacterized protein HemY
MDMMLVKTAIEQGKLPVARSTIYKWHSQRRHPRLVFKVASQLYWDWDEWNLMVKTAIETEESCDESNPCSEI